MDWYRRPSTSDLFIGSICTFFRASNDENGGRQSFEFEPIRSTPKNQRSIDRESDPSSSLPRSTLDRLLMPLSPRRFRPVSRWGSQQRSTSFGCPRSVQELLPRSFWKLVILSSLRIVCIRPRIAVHPEVIASYSCPIADGFYRGFSLTSLWVFFAVMVLRILQFWCRL